MMRCGCLVDGGGHVAVVSVRSSSWWATCRDEVWVFGGWRGAGIPANALRRVGLLLGWGLWKGGGVIVDVS